LACFGYIFGLAPFYGLLKGTHLSFQDIFRLGLISSFKKGIVFNYWTKTQWLINFTSNLIYGIDFIISDYLKDHKIANRILIDIFQQGLSWLIAKNSANQIQLTKVPYIQ
jgi:hypothetical protein